MLGAAVVAGYYALRATSWAVMTDELQVVRLSESIGERLSPVPVIHGVYYGALSQLYPFLLAPFFWVLDAPAAQTAGHVLNALLLPSAAVPAYLLARDVSGSRAAALGAAALTAFTPWLVLTSTLLTENAAYPAFVWAIFFCQRALAAPSHRNDVLALAGLALAFFARTQLLVLAVVLPLALLLHAGPRRAVKQHPVLASVYAAGLAVAALLAAVGSLGAVVGNYEVSLGGNLLPNGVWSSTLAHLVHVVVGAGVLPFVLAVAWVAVRRDAFAALFAVSVPLLSFEVASFDLRFTPHGFNQDRYLFYLVPLFAVGAAAALTLPARRIAPFAVATLGILAVVIAQFGDYDDRTVIFWAAPAAAVHTLFPDDVVLVGAACALSMGGLAVLWRAPRAALVAVPAVVAALGAGQAVYVFQRYSEAALARPPAMKLARDWIDRRVPHGASVALVPAPRDTPAYWWEAELWNKRVDRVVRVDGATTFSPFPTNDLTVDFARGALRGAAPSRFLVVSGSERRFRLVERRQLVDAAALQLVQVDRPYKLVWATRGLAADGWMLAGRRATIRVYGGAESAMRRITVVLAASSRAALPLDFTLGADGRTRAGWVDPGGARPPVRITACVPAHHFVDLTLKTRGSVRIPDGRLVGLHLDRVAVAATGPCSAGGAPAEGRAG